MLSVETSWSLMIPHQCCGINHSGQGLGEVLQGYGWCRSCCHGHCLPDWSYLLFWRSGRTCTQKISPLWCKMLPVFHSLSGGNLLSHHSLNLGGFQLIHYLRQLSYCHCFAREKRAMLLVKRRAAVPCQPLQVTVWAGCPRGDNSAETILGSFWIRLHLDLQYFCGVLSTIALSVYSI